VGVTVIARANTVGLSDVVELEYVDVVGVNSALNAARPKSTGTQSHVAVVAVAATASQPTIEVPPNIKFTVPARDVVAVMRFVRRYCGDADAKAKLTVVEAYPTEIVKFDVAAVAPFASVTETDTVDDPVAEGVPEMEPVEVLKLKPLTKVPVNEYVREARPPEPPTANENALWAVPDKPVVGVAMLNAPATVKVAALEVVEVATPLLNVFVTTTV
jgi:hypothetical protein